MELYKFFDMIKSLNFTNDFSKYVGQKNSLFQSLDEAEARYCNKIKREKYYSFLLNEFGETTIMDIFDVIYFDYPILCEDIKKAYNDKMRKIQNLSQLSEKDSLILLNKIVPSKASFLDILNAVLDDDLLKIMAMFIYDEKRLILQVENRQIVGKRSNDDLDMESCVYNQSCFPLQKEDRQMFGKQMRGDLEDDELMESSDSDIMDSSTSDYEEMMS